MSLRMARASLLLVFLLLVACGAEDVRPVYPVTRVVVVGAGMAGLTTAHALDAAGYDVVVLEARNRIGGRIHTVDVGGVAIDEGAAWLHSTGNNPLVDVARAYGLSTIPDDVDGIARAVSTTHGVYSTAEIDAAFDRSDAFFPRLPALRRSLGPLAPVADGIDAYVAGLGLDGRSSTLTRGMLSRSYFELDYAAPLALQSLRWADEDADVVGGDRLIVGGYRGLVDKLAEGLDVRLGEVVDRIAYDPTGVVVHSTSGDVSASHVVVTVPLGVLRANAIAFDPPLPTEKTAAIARLDLSNLEKVVLRFDTAFWTEIADDTGLVLSDVEGEMPGFFDLTAEAGAPTLVVLYGGAYARTAQATLSDAQLVARALANLETLLGRAVPTPMATHVTHWTTDPFARGAYSYVPVGASPDDMRLYGQPVADRVFFAGEATSFSVSATVHAAFLSGVDAARRLGVSNPRIPGY